MSESILNPALNYSPLNARHLRHGAAFEERDGWVIPISYGDVPGEYAAVRGGGGHDPAATTTAAPAGLIDLSSRGRIHVSGAEAVQFLNGLITNDVKALAEGAWMPAAFPNLQGRLVASARVIRREDGFLFDTEAATHTAILKTLERFTLAGDFRVADQTFNTALLSVQGGRAAEVVGAVFGDAAARTPRWGVRTLGWHDSPVTMIRATHTAEDGFDLLIAARQGEALWDELSERGGARPIGFAALEMLRIEAGIPRYGIDMNDTNVVLEAALDDAVSYTKGCYIGQEIIARIHWRGHVAKRLTGIVLDEAGEVARESKILTPDGKEIGRITSATFSPQLNGMIALGYIRYSYLAPGTEVRVAVGDTVHAAHVTQIPFVRGSWFDDTDQAEGAAP